MKRTPDNGWISVEVPLPECIAENHNWLRILPFRSIGRNQEPAVERGHAEMIGRVHSEIYRRYILREIFTCGCQVPGTVITDNALYTPGLPKHLELWTGDFHPTIVPALVDHHEVNHAIGTLVWKGIYHQAVDDAENCGSCANAERHRNDGR